MDTNESTARNGTEPVIKNSRMKNFLLFILCLIGAFAIWIYAMQSDAADYEETFSSVKVRLINTAALESGTGLSIFSGSDDMIAVTVVGTRSEVSALTADDITATADVGMITEAGTYSVNVSVKVEGKVSVKSLSKNSITVYADETRTRFVEIRAKYTSVTVPSSYELGDLVLSRNTVSVSGPKSALDAIDYAQVSIDAGYMTTSITAIGPLKLIDKNGGTVDNPYLEMSFSEVTVTVPVYAYKEVPLTVSYLYGYFTSDNASVSIEPAFVRIKGDPARLAECESVTLMTVNEKKITENTNSTVQVIPPEGLTLADGDVTAAVSITLLQNYQTKVKTEQIVVTGAPGIYSLEDTSVTVTLRGSLQRLYLINGGDITVYVNLNGFGADASGTVTVPAEIRLSDSFAGYLYELGDYSVRVNLN